MRDLQAGWRAGRLTGRRAGRQAGRQAGYELLSAWPTHSIDSAGGIATAAAAALRDNWDVTGRDADCGASAVL